MRNDARALAAHAGPPLRRPPPGRAAAGPGRYPLRRAGPGPPPPAAPARGRLALVQFLVLLNGTFNSLTYLLGPLGTWLRGPGRNALGWAGIAMLVTAAVWAAGDWYGYEWPKPDLSRFGIGRP